MPANFDPFEELQEIPTPTLTERDLTFCLGCRPKRVRTVITIDSSGNPQYGCPECHAQMRFAYCRGQSTYLHGTGWGQTPQRIYYPLS